MARRRRSSFDDDDVQVPPAPGNARSLALAEAVVELTTAGDYIAEISRLWSDVQRRFIDIGRRLNEAKAKLPHGEFLPMIDSNLPFGRSVANRLMKVAEAVDAGTLPVQQLPQNYSVAYEVVALEPEERQQALDEGIVRPDVRRAEIIAFKRRLRGGSSPGGRSAEDELRRLEAEKSRIEARIAELRRQLGRE